MKKFQLLFYAFIMAMVTLSFNACSNDDDPKPTPEPTPEPKNYHFDIWIALDKHGGMGRDVQTLVKSIDSHTVGSTPIDFKGDGTEVHSVMSLETIVKGKYYYQVPVSGDRISKYILSDNTIKNIQSYPFSEGTNTYDTRKYTHAWIDDNTLVIMASNGDGDKIIWTKLNTTNMSLIEEGILDIPLPEGDKLFSTSGILSYRKSDNKLIYFYLGKKSKRGDTTPFFFTTVINAETMAVESNIRNTIAHQMVGSAYGELLQKCTLVDESGNLYLACFSENEDGVEKSHLIRIKAGEKDFDPTYNAFTNAGKLISLEYLGDGKVLAYARQDDLGMDIDSYSHYYTVIDLNTKTSSRVQYNGKDLPYSGGRFSQRTAIADGKAYIGVNPENTNPCIYIYDIKTGNVEKGADIAEGYYFEQIRVLDNEDAE